MENPAPETMTTRLIADIDLSMIAEALNDGSYEHRWWYDPATGQLDFESEYLEELAVVDPEGRGLVPVESSGSRGAYRDRVDFAVAVGDQGRSERLQRALQGSGAFRRFHDALRRYDSLYTHWHTFMHAGSELRAIDWLVDGGHVDAGDAEVEHKRRTAIMNDVLDAIG